MTYIQGDLRVSYTLGKLRVFVAEKEIENKYIALTDSQLNEYIIKIKQNYEQITSK